MHKTEVTISSRKGLNVLMASRLAAALRKSKSIVLLRSGGHTAGARNILSVLALCATLGTALEVEAFGDDGHLAVKTAEEILADAGNDTPGTETQLSRHG